MVILLIFLAFEIHFSKAKSDTLFVISEFGNWSLFEFWNLGFGISIP
jgi:hypothetical protein